MPAGETKTLTVTEEREGQQPTTRSAPADDEQIRFFISQPLAGEKVKAGLKQAMELRLGEGEDAPRDRPSCSGSSESILEDQARLRANLKEMPTTARSTSAS